MLTLLDSEPPIDLEPLARGVRQSSNFRFAWQWFHTPLAQGSSAIAARSVLDEMIADPACHQFLRDSFVALYDPLFEIQPLHAHCLLTPANEDFEETLARAAAGRLGAYSAELFPASSPERQQVRHLFETPGRYASFELQPGHAAGCQQCQAHNGHLFSSWFYGVAWDWCYVLLWPQAGLAWVGCLTDTD